MREFKFRCWFDNQMHKVADISFKHKSINLCGADIINFNDGILMQYIGLKDRYGNEIYEGDILINDVDEIGVIEYSDTDAVFELVIDDVVENFITESSNWWEVIGNIYKNPELLEE